MNALHWGERVMRARAERATLEAHPSTLRLLADDVLTLLDRVERMRACIEPAVPLERPSLDVNAEQVLRELIRITTGRTPGDGEELDVTLALLRVHPTIPSDITALWQHVG